MDFLYFEAHPSGDRNRASFSTSQRWFWRFLSERATLCRFDSIETSA
jgi:hypothetical protein